MAGAPELSVKLDYTTPAYRDCSAGKFLYNHLKQNGIKKLTAQTKIPSHEKYLRKMGFVPAAAGQTDGSFVKEL